jgi:surface polysaccharide O-acyltransferase-like enzyme
MQRFQDLKRNLKKDAGAKRIYNISTEKSDELQYKTIAFMRFPLMVCVVFVHAHLKQVTTNGVNILDYNTFPIYKYVSQSITYIISEMAVPLFFFISGFLFFKKVNVFSKDLYKQKIHNRIFTLFIPYIIWNLITLLIFFLSQTFFPNLNSGLSKPIIDYTILDYLRVFWDIRGWEGNRLPILEPFWFMRDLMIVCLLSPIIFYLIKKMNFYIVLLAGMMWLLDYNIPITGFGSTSIFFFMTGAYFSIHQKNFINTLTPYLRISIIACIVITIAEIYFAGHSWIPFGHHIYQLFRMVVVITVSAHFVSMGKWKANPFLSKASFFLYGLHYYLITFTHKILIKTMHPHNDITLLGIYIFTPIFVIILCLSLYRFLHNKFPKIIAIMCGGRS